MYRSGPPGAGGCRLRLRSAWRSEATGASAAASDPHLRGYLSDMVAPYQLPITDELFERASGQSYGEMAGQLLAGALPPDEPVDLLVLAFALHDVIPGRSVAVHLSELCPGSPLAFAICDAGAATPFAGLRVITSYARTGGCRRAVLVTVEQATLHYAPASEPAPIPGGNFAVALAFGEAGLGRIEAVRQRAQVTPAEVPGVLAAELAELAGEHDEMVIITGNGLAGIAAPAGRPGWRFGAAPPGHPGTGVWWELAGRLAEWADDGKLTVLADYEAAHGYLCTAAIDLGAGVRTAASPQSPQLTR